MNTNIRSATPMEKARTKAIGFSAFLVVLMLTVAVAFTAIALDGNKKKGPADEVAAPIVFAVPVEDAFVIKEYYFGTQLNISTSRWEGHYALDLGADLGTEVVATYDGMITDVSFTSSTGRSVTIDHGNGLKTVYKSLEDSVFVSVGQAVKQGQPIGTVGTTMATESADGPHVHIEVFKDGVKVNPADYIPYGK